CTEVRNVHFRRAAAGGPLGGCRNQQTPGICTAEERDWTGFAAGGAACDQRFRRRLVRARRGLGPAPVQRRGFGTVGNQPALRAGRGRIGEESKSRNADRRADVFALILFAARIVSPTRQRGKSLPSLARRANDASG